MLKLRQNILKKAFVYFVQNKGKSSEIVERSNRVKLKNDLEIKVNPDAFPWHESLIGLKADSIIAFYGNADVFKDLSTTENFMKLELNGLIKEKSKKVKVLPDLPKKIEEEVEKLPEKPIEKSEEIENPPKKVENPDLVNLIITENRLQNTEMRMSMMKMNEKLDLLLKNPKKSDSSAQIKKIMNKMFKQIKSEIDPSQNYTGQEVIELVAEKIKSSTESLLTD